MKYFIVFLFLVNSGGLANGTTQTKSNPDKPPRLYVARYDLTYTADWNDIYENFFIRGVYSSQSLDEHYDDTLNWQDGMGGRDKADDTWNQFFSDSDVGTGNGMSHSEADWPTNSWPNLDDGVEMENYQVNWIDQEPETGASTNDCNPAPVIEEYCKVAGRTDTSQFSETYSDGDYVECGGDFEYHRHAQVAMRLETGGKSRSHRQNLFRIHITAEAQRLVSSEWYDRIVITNTGPIDPTRIEIHRKSVGSDDNLWLVLPDNSPPIDMTPTIKGIDYYTFIMDRQKYTPVVTANSVPLDPDKVVDGATNFWVGQLLAFSVSGLPDYVDSVQQWSLPGTFVNEQYAYSPVCTSYRKNPDLLSSMTTPSWYVDKVDTGTASIDMNLHFSNGQSVSITAQGKFDMIKPKVSWVGTQPGTIAVNNTFELSNGELWLHFGYWIFDNPEEANDPGMKLTLDTGGLSGALFSEIQLIASVSAEICKANGQVTHLSGSGRDTDHSLAKHDNFYYDDPGAKLSDDYVHVADAGSFQTFLMFTPGDSCSGASIAVPLKLIAWDWSGTADNIGGIWSLTSSSKHVTISDQDTTTFPTWSNTITETGGGYTTNIDTNCN